jgi:hypothetical protein
VTESQRNFLIILAIVLAAMFLSPVAIGIGIIGLIVKYAFVIVIGMLLLVLYQRNSDQIKRMDIGPRIMLIGCGLLLFIMMLSTIVPQLSAASQNELAFFGLSIACVLGMVWAWSQRTTW